MGHWLRWSFMALVLVVLGGCTSAQMQGASSEIHAATVSAQKAIALLEANQATVDEVSAAIASVAPKTGKAHQAALDAQFALSTGNLEAAKSALAVVAAVSAPPPAPAPK